MNVLATALARGLQESAHDLVVLDRDSGQWRRHPWSEVHARAQAAASHILNGPSGAVGLVGEPTVEFVAALFGSWFAGRPLSILPGPVRGADAGQWAGATLERFAGVGAGVVFGHGPALEPLRANDSGLPVHDVRMVARAAGGTHPLPDSTGPAVLQGTAGSTGTPRTAVLSPEAVYHNVTALLTRTRVDPSADVGCTWLPLYHDMGLSFLLAGALSGTEQWLAPTAAFSASPFQWLRWLSESRATMTAAPNFAYNVLGKYARRVSDIDLGALRFALNGGEPVDCEGFANFLSQMGRFGLDPHAAAPSYGLAESNCAVTIPAPGSGLRFDEVSSGENDAVRRHAMLGEPVAGMELRLTTSEHQPVDVPGREVGEIEIRGTSMMSGYLGGAHHDHHTWFCTGDLGYMTDGGLVVCGRVKELITVAGRNVFPTEVERVAAEVKGVREGAVVAVGACIGSARPGLVITAEFRGPNETRARSELVQRVASECGVVPAEVVFVSPGSLPRTSSGKLRRLEVKRNLEAVRS